MIEVGCAGILVADTLCGPIKAIPPAGQILVLDDMLSTVGGCAANVACGLMKQGIETAVTGCVGNDHGAKIVTGELESRGIDCSQIYSSDRCPTSQTVILIVEGEDRRFIHVFGANAAFSGGQISRDWLTGLKAFYVGGFFAMPSFDCKALADVFKLCRDHGVLTVLDVVVPQGMKEFKGLDHCLPFVDYFLPNDDEAALITGRVDPEEQARHFRDLGVGTTIITLGEKGAIAVQDKDFWQVGVFDVRIVDPTGCGDAFDAGLISAAIRGADVPQMLTHAAALGGSCAQAVGCYDGVFTADQAEEFVSKNQLKLAHKVL